MFPIVNLHHGISAIVASGSQKHAPGDRIIFGNAEYVFMYNASNSVISQGLLVEQLSSVSGYSVVRSGTSASLPIGVCVHDSATTGTYFWGLVAGVCPRLLLTAPTAALGAFIFPGPGGQGTTTQTTGVNTALGSISPLGAIGRALDEIASLATAGNIMVYRLG